MQRGKFEDRTQPPVLVWGDRVGLSHVCLRFGAPLQPSIHIHRVTLRFPVRSEAFPEGNEI